MPTGPPWLPHEIVDRIVRSLAPEKIFVFGSHARGSARPGSDVDLLVVGVWNNEPTRLLRHARQLVAHSFPPIDLVLCTPAELAKLERSQGPFLRSIIQSGVLIWPPTGYDPRGDVEFARIP